MTEKTVVVGIDLGTGGARALAVDLAGNIAAQGESAFPGGTTSVFGERVEQPAAAWTKAVICALSEMTAALPAKCGIGGVSAAATSGTFLFLGRSDKPITPGIMYSDLRARSAAGEAEAALGPVLNRYGIKIGAGFALPKIMHLFDEDPSLLNKCHRIVHQTDWILGSLTGDFQTTDISTALKTGADPGGLVWPRELEELCVPATLLPKIVLPGTSVGTVCHTASKLTGLPEGIPVISGCTDGTAGFLASGANRNGDMNVTLGTTLVFKALSSEPLIDPEGSIYNHRHPDGGFLPGGASNTGGDWIRGMFNTGNLEELNNSAEELIPTGKSVYPLIKEGERFPFSNPAARGFGLDDRDTPEYRLASGMEGTAFLERMGIERFEALGLEVNERIFGTGGGTKSELWLKIRASVNQRSYCIPKYPESAMGAALLAAVPAAGSVSAAAQEMVHPGKHVEPDPALISAYEDQYGEFLYEMRKRGYGLEHF